MASTVENQFEIERRNILFFEFTNMPGGGTLGFDLDPNTSVNGATPGQTLLATSPIGTFFQQSESASSILWLKVEQVANVWKTVDTSAAAVTGKTCSTTSIANGATGFLTTDSSGIVKLAEFDVHLEGDPAGSLAITDTLSATVEAQTNGTINTGHSVNSITRNSENIKASVAMSMVGSEIRLTVTNNSGAGNDIIMKACVETTL